MCRFIRNTLAVLVLASSMATGQTAWLASSRTADEARFLFSNQIQRYNLATKSWLAAFSLPRSGATAMAADAIGGVVSYGTSIYRYQPGFTGESLLGTTSSTIQSLFLDGNLVLAVHSQSLYSRITIFDRTTGTKLSSVETYVDSLYGASHAPQSNRLYGRTQGVSPSDIVTAGYSDAGICAGTSDSPHHGDYPGATKTWVFPDDSRVVDSSGTVYTAPGLSYFGSMAGTVTDLAFNGDVPVVLRGNELVAFTPNLLETGRGPAGITNGAALYLAAGQAFVFAPGTSNPALSIVALSTINAPEPNTPTDPNGLAYTVDDAFPDKDGNLLLFSKGQLSLFRWSPATRQYTASYPLSGVPKFAAYSKDNHCAYFADDSQVIRKMDLAAAKPVPVPLYNLPAKPDGLATAGPFVFASDPSGAWGTHYLISATGTLLHSADWNYYSRVWEWDPAKRRMYFFRDDTSPNDLHFETIDTAGKIAGEGETPYHGDFNATPPIRVSPDGGKVVIGSGVVFNTDGMAKAANLANSFADAAWSGQTLVTLRLINGLSQLQVWEGEQFLPGATVRQFSGTPVRLFKTAEGWVVITSVEGTPRFTLLDPAFETLYISPTRPLAPAALAVTGRTTNSVTLQWQDLADNEDGVRLEYRLGTGAWTSGTTVAPNATSGVVTGLTKGTTFEFRALATNGTLISTASPTVTAKTLVAADEPIGEPYNLRVTRIFNNRLTLEWQDNATNETGFRVYRSTSATSLGTQLAAAANAVSFTDSGLAANTLYYYRVQAVNNTVAGDLSAQINARTLSSASAPSSPSGLKAVAQAATVVEISWIDNSTNEDEFIIERSGSPALTWTELGRVAFNLKSFTDTTAVPDTTYTYRVKAVNAAGASTSSTTTAKTPKLGGEFAGTAVRSGDCYYFAFTGPNRIERYDLQTRTWLDTVPLQAPATALWADETGIYVAEDRAVLRFGLDGSSRTAVGNGAATVTGLFTIGDTLVFQIGSSYTTLNKHNGTLLNTFSYGYAGAGFSVSAQTRRVFFRSTSVSPSDIHQMEIGTDGKLVKGMESPYHGDYPSATRTFVFPNGARVADSSGTVYAADSLTYNNSMGGAFTDMSFHGVDVPVVLRNDKLLAYNNALLESGSFTLDAAGLRVAVSGPDAVVFTADGTNPRGLRVQAVPLSAIAAATPGAPIDPRGLAYTPDEVMLDKDGRVLILSKAQLSLFRWSPTQPGYLPTIPLTGAPKFAGYSKDDHRAYLAYDSQVVRYLDLAAPSPVEVSLFNLPAAPNGFTLAGEFPYVAAGPGLMTFKPTGENITTGGFTYYYGNHNVWDPVNRRVYHFRDGISPNDLHYDAISASGQITGGGETPYHGDYAMTKPIRVSPDGSKVVIGSGVVFNAADLTHVASLANGFTDATWFGGELVTIRLISGVTQLQTWTGSRFLAGPVIRQFSGTPVRLLTLDSNQLLLITMVEGVPRFMLLNAALEPTYISPTKPLPPTLLSVAGRSVDSVTLQWQDGADNEDGFRIEYRTGGGNWNPGVTAPANALQGTVTGLAPGGNYEFRVLATLGELNSSPSASVSALTLTSPEQPVGEPYGLRVTRIFSGSITLEWQDNASNETGFRILRSTTAGGTTTTFSAPAGATSFTSTGLTANTSYYFRVQAVNGAIAGDLSVQVSATTRSTNAAPSSPTSLTVTAKSPTSVSLAWTDSSANEDTFQLERSISPYTSWMSLGSVPFNTTSFTDATAVPNTAYSYRVKAVNANGSSGYATVSVTTPKLGGDFAGHSTRSGDVYYFVFSAPHRIERYDLKSRQWLAPIPLQAAATALWVDESAIFAAEDRAVFRFNPDGGDRTPVGNATATITSLFTINEVLAFGSGGSLTTLNKLTGMLLANPSYHYSGTGFSVAPGLNRVFFRSTGVSPSDIHFLEIGPDGKLVKSMDSPYHGSYPSANRTFVFPNGARVADNSGTVYSTDSLAYNNSLGAAFTDLAFHGVDIPIVMRGNKLLSYSNTLLESGSHTLTAEGIRMAVSGPDAVVFIADGANSHGLRLEVVPLTSLAAPVPGMPIEPRGLAYTPDEVMVDRNGELLFLSKSQLSLFRWSPRTKEYRASIPLLGSPGFAAYSAANHCAYLAYATQLIRKLDLAAAEPVETPLFNLPSPPRGLATAGEFVFATDASGAWDSHYLVSPAGGLIDAVDWNYYSRVYQWDPVKRRMYFFRDDTSPNDLHYETIDATGKITGKGETPYHGDFTPAPPIRVSPDGSRVVLGSGAVFETTGMTRLGTLPNTFIDALWHKGEWLTIRASGTATQMQRWNAASLAAGASMPTFAGTPLRLLALNPTTLALVTLVEGKPRIYLLDQDLTLAHTYISRPPLPPAVEDTPYDFTPKLAWQTLQGGAVTVTAPVLPAWLGFSNGVLRGTPLEADSGDFDIQSRNHLVVLRGRDSLNRTEDKEFTLTVAWRNDPPVFVSVPAPVRTNDQADDSHVELGPLLSDPDGLDTRQWRIMDSTNSRIFSSVQIDQTGHLTIVYAPFVSGSSTVAVEVADGSGAIARTNLEVTLPDLPAPLVTADPEIRFSRLTGLYEQKITVRNIAARAIAGFDLTLSGLRAGVRLYNGSATENGGGLVSHHQVMAAGESVSMVLEYHASPRGQIPSPAFGTTVFTPPVIIPGGISVIPEAPAFAINRFLRQEDGSVVIEFDAEPGRNYLMQYCEELPNWKSCPVPIQAGGTKVQWIDRGPPWTDSHPATQPRRFYRVQLIDP